MRHLALLTLALALMAALPAAPAAARSPAATARLVACSTGLTAADRLAVFRGAARRVAGTDRMWIKFKLQERTPGARYRTITAPGLSAWRKSRSGVRRFAVRQRVLALGKGAAYRVAVYFRWYDADGNLLRRARRRSRACRQDGELPNLRVARVGGRPMNGTFRYAVDVVNRGRAASAPTKLALSVDGDLVDTPALGPLAPGGTIRLFVNGPACDGSAKARVDPGDMVAEADERDNSRVVACPL